MAETIETSIERGGGVALWRQIEERLREAIDAGALRPGERLPTEQMLARRFGVNRHTVRRALGALVGEGLVRVEQGRGAFLQEEIIEYALGLRTRFSENIRRQERAPGGRLLDAVELPAEGAAARALALPIGTALLALDTLREANGLPISLSRHFVPLRRFPGLAEAYRELGSLTHAFARYGVGDYTRKWTRLLARPPTVAEARHLRQPMTTPVLQSEAVNIDGEGRPIEYGVAAFAGGRVQILVEE
ncbi:MAG TPA: phosphonate metabolism transcriptional regulator PhnF [Stellaceae bacterium]|nr:phosphonate metabolism transcriptional regulator PhnF [Stellaceae bacterium]